ncbi:MAG: hypothetical protein HPY50_02445 [Firmicutes bacterium]|nr:hypothetical protein [Bacillota bacterium]
MDQTEFLSVSQVADQLKSNYQKVLYMIKTNKMPAKKEGKSFKIPANYQELMAEGVSTPKRIKRKQGQEALPSKRRGRPKKEKTAAKGKSSHLKEVTSIPQKEVNKEQLINNLTKAISDLVEFQVSKILSKK